MALDFKLYKHQKTKVEIQEQVEEEVHVYFKQPLLMKIKVIDSALIEQKVKRRRKFYPQCIPFNSSSKTTQRQATFKIESHHLQHQPEQFQLPKIGRNKRINDISILNESIAMEDLDPPIPIKIKKTKIKLSPQILTKIESNRSLIISPSDASSIFGKGISRMTEKDDSFIDPRLAITKEYKAEHLRRLHEFREKKFQDQHNESVERMKQDEALNFSQRNLRLQQEISKYQPQFEYLKIRLMAGEKRRNESMITRNLVLQSQKYIKTWNNISQRITDPIKRSNHSFLTSQL